jgi:hypothetical protein
MARSSSVTTPGSRPLQALALLSAAIVLTHCAGARQQCVSKPPVSDPTSASQGPGWTYYAPADFDGDTLTFDLPAGPSGRTVLFVVPGARLETLIPAKLPHGTILIPRDLHVRFDVTANRIDVPTSCPAPRLLEEPLHSALPSAPANAVTTGAAFPALPEDRVFHVPRLNGQYVDSGARKVFEGPHYAFYEEADATRTYSANQYLALEGALEARIDEIVRRFGPPTDLDGNGKIVVLFSRTVNWNDAAGGLEGFVDRRNYGAPGHRDTMGEVIFVRALEVERYGNDSDRFVLGALTTTLLHETIHLSQLASWWRRNHSLAGLENAPKWFIEGQAQMFAFRDEFEPQRFWHTIGRTEDRFPYEFGPFWQPYGLGAIFFHWLRGRYGEGVDLALLDGWSRRDPIRYATGAPEPLAIAMMYASLYFDKTPFGRETKLDFPNDDTPKLLPHGAPFETLRLGHSASNRSVYTGHVTYVVDHDAAARISIKSKASDRAYVLVAQP